MNNQRRYRIIVPMLAGLLAVGLLCFGQFGMAYKIYEKDPANSNDPFILFETISDSQMAAEATYSGVERSKNDSFYFTYDRSNAQLGAKPCPT